MPSCGHRRLLDEFILMATPTKIAKEPRKVWISKAIIVRIGIGSNKPRGKKSIALSYLII